MRARDVGVQDEVEVGHGGDAVGREGHDACVVDEHVEAMRVVRGRGGGGGGGAVEGARDLCHSRGDGGFVGRVKLHEDDAAVGGRDQGIQGRGAVAGGGEDGADFFRRGDEVGSEGEAEAAGAAGDEIVSHFGEGRTVCVVLVYVDGAYGGSMTA